MKVSEMFPRTYLTGADLQGKTFTLEIAHVRDEQMRPAPNTPPVTKYVLYFSHTQKGLILNRTIASQIAEIAGDIETDNWKGVKVTIYPVHLSVAGQNRIAIRVKPPINGPTTPPPAATDDPDDA